MRSYTVILLPSAQADLEGIDAYLSGVSRAGADHVHEALVEAVRSLAVLPHRYPTIRRRALAGPARRVTCFNYRIVYTVRGSDVVVLRVLHAARRVPRRLI